MRLKEGDVFFIDGEEYLVYAGFQYSCGDRSEKEWVTVKKNMKKICILLFLN